MVARTLLAVSVLILFFSLVLPAALAAEKVRFGTPVRVSPLLSLPLLAAEEKGFWKQQGIQAEWTAFRGGELIRAMAAGGSDIAMSEPGLIIQGISKGLPAIIIGDLKAEQEFFIWVRADSPIREPRQLKGLKIGTSRLGGGSHINGQIIVKGLGLEKAVKWVAAGGVPEMIAALKTGGVEAIVLTPYETAPLKVKGEVREIVSVRDFLPKEWTGLVVFAMKEFAKKNPELVKRTLRVLLLSSDFLLKDEGWTVERMKSFIGYPEDAARWIYRDVLRYGRDARIDRKALENAASLLIEYGIITKEEVPPVDALYTAQFLD